MLYRFYKLRTHHFYSQKEKQNTLFLYCETEQKFRLKTKKSSLAIPIRLEDCPQDLRHGLLEPFSPGRGRADLLSQEGLG